MTSNVPMPVNRSNPYIGPRSFRTGETLYGRDHEVSELLDLLIAERVVLLYSPSGAGKSSLVQAALVPRLTEEGFRVLPVMRVSQEAPTNLVPGRGFNRYIFSLLLSLEETVPESEQLSLAELAATNLVSYLEHRAEIHGAHSSAVLIFDQFEEILTVNPADHEARSEFFAQVGLALRDRTRWAVFAMREDYIAGLDPYLRPIPTRLTNRFRLDLLEEAAARAAMQQPAQSMGVDFTEEAARKLANDLRAVRVQRADGSTAEQLGLHVEPVQLQVVCYRLWDRLPAEAQQIVEADIVALGNVNSALSDYYAERVASAAQAAGVSERAIREWFEHQLITTQGIRGQVLQGADQGLDGAAIQRLLDAYLVRGEKRRGATWYELAHDRLIEPVQTNNAAWREANLSALQHQADLWDKQNRPDGLLLRDRVLSEAEQWAEAHAAELTSTERDFLTACRKARANAQRERRNNRLIRGLAVAALIGLILASIASVVASQNAQRADAQSLIASQNATRAEEQARIADEQRTKAETARQLAADNEKTAIQERDKAVEQQKIASAQKLVAQAQIALKQGNQNHIGMLLALEAQQRSPSAESEAVLREGLPRLPSPLGQLVHQGAVNAVAFRPDGVQFATASDDGLRVWTSSHGEQVRWLRQRTGVASAAYSPDGQWLVSGEQKLAHIWDAASGKEIAQLEHADWVTSIAFSPDGQWLATASEDGSVNIWKTANLRAGQTDPSASFKHDAQINQIAFSPDSTRLASASDDGTSWVWDVAANREIGRLPLNGPGLSVAFSPDGRQLATGGSDFTARMWEATPAGTLSETMRFVLDDWVEAVTFSPDGKTLGTASDDATARLWDLSSGKEKLRLSHLGHVNQIAFSPDGRWLATGSNDLTARLWDTVSGQEVSQLPQRDSVTAVDFSPDGSRLVTADVSGQAQLWDIDAAAKMEVSRIVQKDLVRSLAFSPDGTRLATASDDGFTAWLWDIQNTKVITQFSRDNQNFVRAVAISPDARWLAAGSDDKTVWLWDLAAEAGAAPQRLVHDDAVNTVAFSPDGKLVASGSADLTARIWDVATGQERQKIDLTGSVTSVAFSPDGTLLITSDENGFFSLWDVATGKEQPVGEVNYLVRDAVLSPDGTVLAVAADRFVYVWDVTTKKELRRMIHAGEVRAVAFSPDGKLIASTSDDGTTRVWDAASGEELTRIYQPGNAQSVVFSPAGNWLASTSRNTARIWDVKQLRLVRAAQLDSEVCARLTRNLTADEWRLYLGDQPYRKTCPNLP